MQLKNISTGDRGVYTDDGTLIMVAAGQTVEGEFEDFSTEWFEEAKADEPKKAPAKKPAADE